MSAEDETVDISEAVEMGAAVIWNVQHQHDSYSKGRTWETAVQGVPGLLEESYERDVAYTRWLAEIERSLATMESMLEHEIYELARLYRGLHRGRDALRSVLGLPPLGPVAPFYEARPDGEDAPDGTGA